MPAGGSRIIHASLAPSCARAPAIALALAGGAPRGGGARRGGGTGDSLVVSVLTMGPGREVFERFGHISIRIHGLRTGMDSSYNWGMFSFEQPRFLQRFLTDRKSVV